MDTTGEKEKRTPKENVHGSSTSSHDNKKFRNKSLEKQIGMAFGFRRTATAVKNTGWMDGCVGGWMNFLWITEVLAGNPIVYCI
jgi:hypothetical protein